MTMKPSSVVHSDPEIMGGTPVFIGTRVPLQNLIDYLEGGESIEDFLDGFPSLKREQVIAVIEAHAARRRRRSEAGFYSENRLQPESMSTKEILLEVAEKLPPDATLVDAIYELEFRQAVEDGLASLDRGERIPLEEARKRIPQWISKYSSPTKP